MFHPNSPPFPSWLFRSTFKLQPRPLTLVQIAFEGFKIKFCPPKSTSRINLDGVPTAPGSSIRLPGNEDFSLNSLREARGVEEFFSTSPQQRRLQDSDSDNREFDIGIDSHPASFGFLD